MNIVFVSLFYSTGLPLLISATFIYLTSTYYIDKFMMFRFCRTPPNYPKELEKSIRTICWIVVPLHCILSVWMLGSTKLFAGTSVRTQCFVLSFTNVFLLFISKTSNLSCLVSSLTQLTITTHRLQQKATLFKNLCQEQLKSRVFLSYLFS